MRYVKFVSWHVITITYRSGLIGTRCGRMAAVEGSLSNPQNLRLRETSETLPLDEKTCERCAVLTLHDEENAV